jgi:hypothetical protein
MKLATGKELVKGKTADLFAEVERICAANEAEGINVGSDEVNCTITNGLISLTIGLNVLDGELSVSEWSCRVPIPGEPISGFRFFPAALRKTCFAPERPLDGDFCWREKRKLAQSLSVVELAEKCVSQFMALEQRDGQGQIKRKSFIESQISPMGR